MTQPKPPIPVKLFCAILAVDETVLAEARTSLSAVFGEPDASSAVAPFDTTDYYRDEMGAELLRQFVTFRQRIDPGTLVEAKVRTNRIESELAARTAAGQPSRRVNLDPGYLNPSRLVLASCKDFSHRVYIGRGVYAELTLTFHKEGCRFFDWTYPEYRSNFCTEFLLRVRRQVIDEGG